MCKRLFLHDVQDPVTPETFLCKGFQAIIILILIINRTHPQM